ncbi:MAG: hypothetical protein ACLFTK_05805 [Anaerolineales bacterium]
MVSRYHSPGPPAPLVIISGISIVMLCVIIWTLSFTVLDAESREVAQNNATQAVFATRTESAAAFAQWPTPTPAPVCEFFSVWSERAVMRICPDTSCQSRQLVYYGQEVCSYGRAEASSEFPTGQDWHIIDLNYQSAFRDLVYMHHSILVPSRPTPRPSATYTPLPTITRTPAPPSSTPTLTPPMTSTPAPTLAFPTFDPESGGAELSSPPPNLPLPGLTPTSARPSF